jgi:hypothetical protein
LSEQYITISYSNRSTAQDNCLKFEQEPWSQDVGKTSEMQAILAISAATYGGRWPEVNCGGLNGQFNATMYVYPCTGATFQFHVSWGRVVSRRAELLYREDIIQTDLELKHTPDYPVRFMALMSWIGKCYDHDGNVVAAPSADYDSDTGVITVSREVYGSLRVRYTVRRYTYQVQINRRPTAQENKYQSTAYVVFNGGVKWLEIEAPSGFEAFDGDCGNGAFYEGNLQNGYYDGGLSQTSVCTPEYSKLPTAVTADRYIEVAYCSQEVISDKTKETVDWDTEKEKCK